MKNRVCSKCGTEKPLAQFYKDKTKKDGHRKECKDCTHIKVKKYRKTDAGKRARKIEQKRRRASGKSKITGDKWNKNNKEKVNAKKLIWYHTKAGNIKRPNACSLCKKVCKPEGHHYDYTKPVDGIWVCKQCHEEIHMLLHDYQKAIEKCNYIFA